MKMSFETDDDFTEFKEEVRKRLAVHEVRDLSHTGMRHASVMMLIMNKNGAPHVLLTRRTDTVSLHKGQVSFPGGGADEVDDGKLSTAYRETFEEVGIGGERIEYLGRFDDYISISGFLVTCFIGAIDYPYACTINRHEIESCFEAPLSTFVNQEYDRYEIYNYGGSDYRVLYYHYEGYEIWGLTARILTDFGEKICRN